MAVHAQDNIILKTIPAYTALLEGHFRFGDNQGTNVVQNNVESPSSWGYNTHIGSNGIELRHNTDVLSRWTTNKLEFLNPVTKNSDVVLDTNGLTLSKGGIIAGDYVSTPTKFIYLSTQDYNGSPTITINGNSSGWRQIIGSKFGVKNDGTLYAANVNISGSIVASTGTIGGITIGSSYLTTNAERTTYDAVTSGLTITPLGIGAGSGSANTFKVEAATGKLVATNVDITGNITATSGAFTGSITASSGSISNEVTIGSEQKTVSTVLSDISDAAKVATNYITQIDANGIWVTPINKKPTDTSTGAGATGTKIDGQGVGIYDEGNKKAQYGSSAIIYGGNGTYPLTEVSSSGITIAQDVNNKVVVGSNTISIYSGGYNVAEFGSSSRVGSYYSNNILLDGTGIQFYNSGSNLGFIQDVAGEGVRYYANGTRSQVWFGLGSNGANRGMYDETTGNWIIHLNSDHYAVIPFAGAKYGTSGNPLYVSNTGVLTHGGSSIRYKKDIDVLKDKNLDANKLYDLQVRQFKFKEDILDKKDERYNKLMPGFIAEEVDKIYPIAVTYQDELPENWDARYLLPPMLKLIQDQKKKIDELESRINNLES